MAAGEKSEFFVGRFVASPKGSGFTKEYYTILYGEVAFSENSLFLWQSTKKEGWGQEK